MLYDVIIIGGGPAAIAAGVYVARKQLKSLLLTESFGGQSIVSNDIENWIGEKHIAGVELARKLEDHVRAYPEVLTIKDGERAQSVTAVECDISGICDFVVKTESGEEHHGKSIIVATGARRRKLGAEGEKEFDGRGVAYCSTCDAPLFRNKVVAVIGGGNAALEGVVDLFPYASKIYLLVRGNELKGDPITQAEVKNNSKVEIIYNMDVKKITGDKVVNGLIYIDSKTNEEKNLTLQGVFIEIGSMPNSEIIKGLVDIDPYGQVIVDSKRATTSKAGVFAAGDITDDPFKQNNISAGDGVRAALSAYDYLLKRKKKSPAEEL